MKQKKVQRKSPDITVDVQSPCNMVLSNCSSHSTGSTDVAADNEQFCANNLLRTAAYHPSTGFYQNCCNEVDSGYVSVTFRQHVCHQFEDSLLSEATPNIRETETI
jgi:hypothetical protein